MLEVPRQRFTERLAGLLNKEGLVSVTPRKES